MTVCQAGRQGAVQAPSQQLSGADWLAALVALAESAIFQSWHHAHMQAVLQVVHRVAGRPDMHIMLRLYQPTKHCQSWVDMQAMHRLEWQTVVQSLDICTVSR